MRRNSLRLPLVGAIGTPHDVQVPIDTVVFSNIGLRGGVSPVRRYIPELLFDVLDGRITPGRVRDYSTDLDGIVDAYEAMNEGAPSSLCCKWARRDRCAC